MINCAQKSWKADLIFAAQALRIWFGNDPVDTTEGMLNAFMFAVAVAVVAIPEVLSSIVTIIMAVGINTFKDCGAL